jgi:hypothetical protein
MKQKRPGKMLSKALGPYKFVKYKNEHGLVAVLETIAGKQVECSVANVLPLRPGVRPLQQWKARLKAPAREQLWDSEEEQFGSD